MNITKNKFHQILFFVLIFLGSIFNGSNSNTLILINFIIFLSFLFYLLLSNNNNIAVTKYLIKKNKRLTFIFIIFIFYLVFQIIPLPVEWLNFFSKFYYDYLEKIDINDFKSISLNPFNTLTEIANYLNIFMIVMITNLIFFKKKHAKRYLFYLVFIGFLHAFIAVYLFLIGNPEFFLEKIVHYKNSSTGLFVNRTNFSFFLILSFLAGLHLVFKKEFNLNQTKNFVFNIDFFYVRIFLIFISIAIITSFSRLGNFYLALILLLYFFYSIKTTNKIFNNFTLLFLGLIVFDLLILGIYFGGSQLVDRFYFINEDLNFSISNSNTEANNFSQNLSRVDIIKIGFNFFKKFYLFGYGAESFQITFFLFYENLNKFYANHVHADFIELLGELGIMGCSIIIIFFYYIFKKIFLCFLSQDNNFKIVLITLISIFLINGFIDFSLNIPSNQYVFSSLLALSIKKYI